ncbi:MAG: hypothetical protein IPJ20_24735 [Flammeovirgaceae bacterium]|nr:hypothetical protein [Flammeovirgaceae bacterium]
MALCERHGLRENKKIGLAKDELTRLKVLVDKPAMKELTISGFNTFESVLAIGVNVLEGEVQSQQGI